MFSGLPWGPGRRWVGRPLSDLLVAERASQQHSYPHDAQAPSQHHRRHRQQEDHERDRLDRPERAMLEELAEEEGHAPTVAAPARDLTPIRAVRAPNEPLRRRG